MLHAKLVLPTQRRTAFKHKGHVHLGYYSLGHLPALAASVFLPAWSTTPVTNPE